MERPKERNYFLILLRITEQTQFFSSHFTQSMTGKPYSSIAWDMWIEMTMNKGSKMKAGWLSILRNEKQLMVDIRNVNNLSRIQAALHNQVSRKQLSRKHNECAPARMRRDEQAVQDLVGSLIAFRLIQHHLLFEHCNLLFLLPPS